MKHDWTECDDIVALYLFRFGESRIGISIEEAAKKLEIPDASMKKRIRNFRNLNSGGGLSHFSKQSKIIFDRFRTTSEPELRDKAIKCLNT